MDMIEGAMSQYTQMHHKCQKNQKEIWMEKTWEIKLKEENNSFNVEVIQYHRNCRSRNVHCILS